jgi:hypothetical protein
MKSDFLTENEVQAIEAFCKNETMFEAVKKVILQTIYSHGVNVKGKKQNPLINGALNLVALSTNNPIPDEQLGQNLRGIWAGLELLERGYKNLTEIKTVKKEESEEENTAI